MRFPACVDMDLYAENILEHYRHPRHRGVLDGAAVEHEERNVSCGDTLTVRLRIEGDQIAGVAWEGQGCAISQAAMSILSETLSGRSTEEIAQLSAGDVRAMLGVPVGTRRAKCAFLCLHAVQNAIRAAAGQPPQDWAATLQD